MTRRKKAVTPAYDPTVWVDYTKDTGRIDPRDLHAAIENAGVFVYDLETTDLDLRKASITGVAFYVPASRGAASMRAWFPFRPNTFLCYGPPPADGSFPELLNLREEMDQESTMDALRPIWAKPSKIIAIAHHAKFDTAFLYHKNGTDKPIYVNCIQADSMLADFVADERRRVYGLKQRVFAEFSHKMTTFAEAVQQVAPLAFLNAKPLAVYGMDDCYWTFRHHDRALTRLREQTPAPKARQLISTAETLLGQPMGKLERIYWGIDIHVSRILMEMETSGVLIDWRHLREVEERLTKEQRLILDRMEQYLGWPLNPNSNKQVADALFAPPPDGLGLPQMGVPRGASGEPSTADKAIKHFARFHPLVADVIKWRSLDTLLGSFVTKLIKLSTESSTGRIHSGFNQTSTVIARLSSSKPINLQNQPREKNLVRKAYCAYREGIDEPDMLLFGADYGQIELRVAAHLANEENMIEVYAMGGICKAENGLPCDRYTWYECGKCDFTGAPGLKDNKPACIKCGFQGDDKKKFEHQARCRHVDLHQRTADDAKVKRNPLAKNLNFGLLYRMAAPKFCVYADLFDADGFPMLSFAKDVIARWFAAYPAIPIFHEVTEHNLEANNWVAETLFGRRRRLDQEMRFNRYRAVTQGIQFKVSGSAQDIMKAGMVQIFEKRNQRVANSQPEERKAWEKVRFLMQIHDEIVVEAPKVLKAEVCDLIKTSMEGVGKGYLRVPLAVDVKTGLHWDSIH